MANELSLAFTTPLLLFGERISATSGNGSMAHAMARLELIPLLEKFKGDRFPYPFITQSGAPIALTGKAAETFDKLLDDLLLSKGIWLEKWPDDKELAKNTGARVNSILQATLLDIESERARHSDARTKSMDALRASEKPSPHQERIMAELSSEWARELNKASARTSSPKVLPDPNLLVSSDLKKFIQRVHEDRAPLAPKDLQDYGLAKFAAKFMRANPQEATSPPAAPTTPIVVATASPARGAPAGKHSKDTGGRNS